MRIPHVVDTLSSVVRGLGRRTMPPELLARLRSQLRSSSWRAGLSRHWTDRATGRWVPLTLLAFLVIAAIGGAPAPDPADTAKPLIAADRGDQRAARSKPTESPSPAASTPAPSPPPAPKPTKPAPPPKPKPVAWLNQAQMDNAAVIVKTGQKLRLPKRAYVIAVATAIQESKLLNLANPTVPASLRLKSQGMGYDHDSVGLFQQRPSSGWGTPAQLLNPEYSAGAFYAALARVPGWQSMALTWAAQSVQVSAFPYAYAQHETLAQQIVDVLTKQ